MKTSTVVLSFVLVCVEAWGDGSVIDLRSVTKIHSDSWILVEPGATVILGDAVEFTSLYNTVQVEPGGQLIMGGLTVGQSNLLQAAGTIATDLLNAGTLAPGSSPGMLTVDSYAQTAAGTLQIELAGTIPGDEYDVLAVTGPATLDGLLAVLVDPLFEVEPEMEFWVLRAGSLTGLFDGLADGAVAWSERGGDGDRLLISYRADGVYLFSPLAEVPEPATALLLALGGFALLRSTRRRSRD